MADSTQLDDIDPADRAALRRIVAVVTGEIPPPQAANRPFPSTLGVKSSMTGQEFDRLRFRDVSRREPRLVAIDENDRAILALAAEALDPEHSPPIPDVIRRSVIEQLWALRARPGILAVCRLATDRDGSEKKGTPATPSMMEFGDGGAAQPEPPPVGPRRFAIRIPFDAIEAGPPWLDAETIARALVEKTQQEHGVKLGPPAITRDAADGHLLVEAWEVSG